MKKTYDRDFLQTGIRAVIVRLILVWLSNLQRKPGTGRSIAPASMLICVHAREWAGSMARHTVHLSLFVSRAKTLLSFRHHQNKHDSICEPPTACALSFCCFILLATSTVVPCPISISNPLGAENSYIKLTDKNTQTVCHSSQTISLSASLACSANDECCARRVPWPSVQISPSSLSMLHTVGVMEMRCHVLPS